MEDSGVWSYCTLRSQNDQDDDRDQHQANKRAKWHKAPRVAVNSKHVDRLCCPAASTTTCIFSSSSSSSSSPFFSSLSMAPVQCFVVTVEKLAVKP